VKQIKFTVYARPEPQGSAKGFVLPGKFGAKPRAIITTANPKLKPYRQELTHTAQAALAEAGVTAPMAGKHVPVSVVFDFYLSRPESIPKKRTHLVVKPDADKLTRSTLDAMTGILFADDAQVVELSVRKHYGSPERADISVSILEGLPGEGLF
jgi:Holliday junction resolvase RusA-like endonuclease